MHKKKILIIDDERDFAELIKARLEANGYAVSAQCDPKEAEAFAVKEKPDLILLDIVMPGMDGYQLCLALEKDKTTAGIPVILLTGKDIDPQTAYKKGLDLGVAGFVAKPVDIQDLLAKVKNAIG
jgi:DNA-binding response OmpR family regulator